MATEIFTFKAKEGYTSGDAQGALDFPQPLPKGLQWRRWGRVAADPNTFVFFLNWDSVADHSDWVKTSPHYATAREKIDSMLAQPVEASMYHTHLQPFVTTKIFGADISSLRVCSMAKRPDVSREKFEATRDEMMDIMSKAPGFQSHCYGVQHEDDNVYIVLIAWDSFESRVAFSKSRPDLDALLAANIDVEKSSFHDVILHPSAA